MSGVLDRMGLGLTPAYQRGMERLALTFGATGGTGITAIAPYDFQAYQTRYGRPPQSPRYLISGAGGTVRVWFTRDTGLPEGSVDVVVPAGRTVAVPLPGDAASITHTLRLTRFQPHPPAPIASSQWRLEALLGNLAKLLWVAGAEHEEVAGQLADVAAQRNAPTAHGASLDLLGRDLSVPRFPPRPSTWDTDTVALYHLDEPPGALPIAGERGKHPGTNTGGQTGRPGRFGRAVEFTAGPPALISVPDHADFALPAGAPFTVEVVVRPGASTATGTVVAKRGAGAGWSLAVGTFRGIDRNPRFTLADGASTVELFADVDLGDGAFHHLAGALDPPFARLYLDGALAAESTVDPFGALTNAEPLRVGPGFVGLVDEVRVSSVARAAFHPVVGEGDDEYRRRLAVFQRWLVPTPAALAAALNEMAGPVAGNPLPFVVDEGVDPLVIGTLPIRVLPAPLAPGQCVGADGDPRTTEAAAVGTVDDEPDFDEAWLRRHEDRPGLDFGGVEANRMMQWSVRAALGRLLDRLSGATGRLVVARAHDPAAADLYRVGRALELRHETVEEGELAVQAHAAGFGWVCRTGDGHVHAAQARADAFRITPPAVAAPDVVEGAVLTLGLDPDPAVFADAAVAWSLVHCGPGSGTLALAPGKKATLHAVKAGDLSVHAEVVRRRHTAGGSRTVRIGLSDTSLGAGQSIGRDGTRGVAEPPATEDFDELYLVTRTDDQPSLTYGTDPANRRMQRVTARALDRLVTVAGGVVTVVQAYDPAATGLLAHGRALRVRHSTLTPSALAARAFAAGLDYIKVEPPNVYVAVAAGEQVAIQGPTEVRVGASVTLEADPQARPAAVVFSADGARAYVADRGSARVTAFTLAASPPSAFPALALDRSVRVLGTPTAVAHAGTRVFVAHELPGAVSVLDAGTLAAGAAPLNTGPRPVAMATSGTRLFVVCAGDKTLRAYDIATLAPLGSVVLPDRPRSIAVGTSLYVVIDGNRFCPVNPTTLAVSAPVASGAGATYAVVSTGKLYVSCVDDNTVRIYATATNLEAGTIAVSGPGALAVDQKYLYAATVAGRVRVVELATDTLLPQIFTPGSPSTWLATSPAAAAYQSCFLAVSATGATVTLGDPAPLGGVPPRPPRVATSIALGSGDGEHLGWATVPFSRGRVALSSLVKPTIQVTGEQAGAALVRLVSVRGEHLLPYQFEVRLVPALDANPAVELTKDQYDLVMNVLNWFHPIGVEVRTDRIRAHVPELGDEDLFPDYTYPAYRLPSLLRGIP